MNDIENETMYIPLYNVNCSLCYFVTALHKLHSSKTLNKLVLNNFYNDPFLELLHIYATVSRDNITNIQLSIKEKSLELFTKLSSTKKNGGYSEAVLTHLYGPLIYHYFTDDFDTIFRELRFPSVNFRANYIGFEPLNWLDIIYNTKLKKYYNDMIKHTTMSNYDFTLQPSLVEMCKIIIKDRYGSKTISSGHAVAFLNSNNGIYIIDDGIYQIPIKEYFKDYSIRINSIILPASLSEDFLKKIENQGLEVEVRIGNAIIDFDDKKYTLPILLIIRYVIIIAVVIIVIHSIYRVSIYIRGLHDKSSK